MKYWVNDVYDAIEALNFSFNEERKLKVYELKRIILLVNKYGDCEQCKNYQMSIERLIAKLEQRKIDKEYRCLIALIKRHMIQEHMHIQKGTSFSICSFIGVLLGCFVGYFFTDHLIMSTILGFLVFGTLGIFQEVKIKKGNKMI